MSKKAVVILEVMWDWEARVTSAGYVDRAPKWFRINPRNFTGRRLHAWLKQYDDFWVTNACPQLVNNAKGRGTPDKEWLNGNLKELHPFDLLLVCGKVAQATYDRSEINGARIIGTLHPAARCWNARGLQLVADTIASGNESARITFKAGTFTCETLHPAPK